MNFWLAYLLIVFGLWGNIILFHELGHIIAYRLYGYKPKMTWDKGFCLETKAPVPPRRRLKIIALGIALGMFPLLVLVYATPWLLLDLVWVLFYCLGCSFDVKEIFRIIHLKYNKDLTKYGEKF